MSVNNVLPLRIYPLSTEEFPENCDVKCYFRYGLREEYGKFHYRNKPIVTNAGTVVLFQYNQHIVAQAELLEKPHKLKIPLVEGNIEYHGYFLFDLETVRYYSQPLRKEEFFEIYPDKPLNRVTHILDDEEKNRLLLQKLAIR